MGYIFPNSSFYNAQNAFVMLYDIISRQGENTDNGTKAIYNIGFDIINPRDNKINVDWRNWKESYAKREWEWYLSKNRSVEELKKYAPIWDKMHNRDNIVNSNYGFLWNEQNQLEKTIKQLRDNKATRRAWITLFDGKNKDDYTYDTPCTLSIGFRINKSTLHMNVLMRSNDLWFGFCNDQYCFSNLHMMVADELKLNVGTYYHYASDMHIYNRHLNKNIIYENQIKS